MVVDQNTAVDQCTDCGVFKNGNPYHICVRYDGPPCVVEPGCTEPTVVCDVSAPGTGRVRVCRANHTEEITPVRELTIWDVI